MQGWQKNAAVGAGNPRHILRFLLDVQRDLSKFLIPDLNRLLLEPFVFFSGSGQQK